MFCKNDENYDDLFDREIGQMSVVIQIEIMHRLVAGMIVKYLKLGTNIESVPSGKFILRMVPCILHGNLLL